jgi:O-methyltransferase
MSRLLEQLEEQSSRQLAVGHTNAAIIGLSAEALELAHCIRRLGGNAAIFDPGPPVGHAALTPWEELVGLAPNLVIIASDERKETLLRAGADALDDQRPLPCVVLAGLAHQELADPTFTSLEAPALVPSYATGHPHTRRHLYDCLRAAAYNGRSGAIVELGAFKGGTSAWLSRAADALGLKDTRVIAFDAWDGFPPRASLLDLYEHPRCVFRNRAAVEAYITPYGVELVAGDIAVTAPARLAQEPVLLAFIDTDNYTATRAALPVILEHLVIGGAIVFDHYWTTTDYAYTVGERLAAHEVLGDSGLLQLHGTGVFINSG